MQSNRSIHYLHLDFSFISPLQVRGQINEKVVIWQKDALAALTPFILYNENLRSLSFSGVYMNSTCIKLIADSLSKRKNKESIKQFHFFTRIGLCSEDESQKKSAVELMDALSQYWNIRMISLEGSNVTTEMIYALKSYRCDPKCNLIQLHLARSTLAGDRETVALADALVHNRFVKNLSLKDNQNISIAGWEALSAAFGGPGSVLRELSLSECRIGDKGALVIARALASNNSLRVLDLGKNGGIRSGWKDFFHTLRNNNMPLEDLNLKSNEIDNEGVLEMSNAFSNTKTLKILNLGFNRRIHSTGWEAIARILLNPKLKLQELNLASTSIYGSGASVVANAIARNKSLKVLNLFDSIHLWSLEWGVMLASLGESTLVELDLSCTEIDDDETAEVLANALANNTTLRKLDLNNNEFSASVFSIVFQNPNSALEFIRLWSYICDEGALAITDALASNTTLRQMELLLDPSEECNSMTDVGISAFARLLCNKSSIMDTFASNHTLEVIDNNPEKTLSKDIAKSLKWNENCNKHEVARLKILGLHFDGEISIEPFVEMDFNVLPCAMAWIGKDSAGHSLMYKLIRGMPALSEHTNTARAVGGKRKRLY